MGDHLADDSLTFRFQILFPVIDRMLLLSWLTKDFGWMLTNYYIGFPFGCVCVLSHLVMFCADPRPSFRFYNISLLLWVVGNFTWMSSEFIYTSPSSNVHFGPRVPLEDPSSATAETTTNALGYFKACMFLAAVSIQFLFYLGMATGHVKMPDDEEDDVGVVSSRNELLELLGMQPSTSSGMGDGISDGSSTHPGDGHNENHAAPGGGNARHLGYSLDEDAVDDDDLDHVGQSLHGYTLLYLLSPFSYEPCCLHSSYSSPYVPLLYLLLFHLLQGSSDTTDRVRAWYH